MRNVPVKNAPMKKTILFAAAMLAAVAVEGQEPPGIRFDVQTRVPLEAKTIKGAPYSAEIVTDHTQTLADGNRIVRQSTGRVYRDQEGRVRREEDRASGTAAISIVDPVGGVTYVIEPEQHIAWKTAAPVGSAIVEKLKDAKLQEVLKRREAAARKAEGEKVTVEVTGGRVERILTAGGEQHNEERLASRLMEGLRVDGRRMTTTIAAGTIGNDLPITIVSEEWMSPDLQVLVMTQRTDPRSGDSTYRLVDVVRSEPDASLFEVPSEYVVKETGIRRFEVRRDR